jgi:Putative zinc-finger
MPWTCPQIEERLSDYLDHALPSTEAQEFEAHVHDCARCAPLVARVSVLLQGIRQLEPLDAPLHLVPQILDRTLGPRQEEKGLARWLRALRPLFQPQFALGATAVLATLFLMGATILPVHVRKTDLHPGTLFRSANRQAHMAYAHSVKFVNDMRVVYEIQSRLRAEPSPAQQPQAPSAPSSDPQQKSQGDHNGHSANSSLELLACALLPDAGRNSQ